MMEVTAALAKTGGEPLTIEELTLEGLGEYDVLIENRAAGLCASDVGQFSGDKEGILFPLLPGHEGSGVVLEVGKSVKGIRPGDRVATTALGEHDGKPGVAAAYRESDHFSFDGEPVALTSPGASFATHTICNEVHVVVLPEAVPFDVGCLLSCAVMTGVGSVVNTAAVRPDSTVVVFGLGGVGFNCVDGALLAGARQIIGVDLNPDKEALGREFGVTDFICAADNDHVVEQIRDLSGGGVDYSFECSGVKPLVQQSIDCTLPESGTVTLVGIPKDPVFQLNLRDVFSGRLLTGSYFGKYEGQTGILELANWFLEGKLHTDKLITHRIKLDQVNEGFDTMKSGKAIRNVIEF